MTDILGHDINGRPLQAGDEVVVVDAGPHYGAMIGKIFTVTGPAEPPYKEPEVEITGHGKCGDIFQRHIARINQDHQPAGSFDDVMAGLRQPKKETNDERV